MKKVILTLVVVATMFGLLNAAPFQTLGMLRTPDAYVLPHKAAEFMVAGYYMDIAKPVEFSGFMPYAMVGAGIMDRVELGAFIGSKVNDEPMVYFLNAKVKLLEETNSLPQIAVGMDNIFSSQNYQNGLDLVDGDDFYNHPDKTDYENFSMYAVVSKQAHFLNMPWMVNLGMGTNRFSGQVSRSRLLQSSFVSAEFSPINNLAVQGEFDGADFNVGLRYSHDNWSFKLGAQAVEDLAKNNGYEDNLRVAFGVSYLFDKYAEAQRRPQLSNLAVHGGGGKVDVGSQEAGGLVVPSTGAGDAAQSMLSPEIRNLLEELRVLREERSKAQQSLDELRQLIRELKQ